MSLFLRVKPQDKCRGKSCLEAGRFRMDTLLSNELFLHPLSQTGNRSLILIWVDHV